MKFMNHKIKHNFQRNIIWWLLFCLLPSTFLIPEFSNVFAQDSLILDWSFPAQIPQFDQHGRTPIFVADRSNQVHAFSVNLDPENNGSIAYRRWNKNIGWTIPTDIILPAQGVSARVFGAVIDDDDYIHLVIYFGIELDAGIYHYSAPVTKAHAASAWSEPKLLSDMGGSLSHGAFISDGANNFYAVYQGKADGIGLYEIFSNDAGQTWSKSRPIFLSEREDYIPAAMDLHLDDTNNLHAVWSTWSTDDGNGKELYYAQRNYESQNWSRPFLIARKEGRDFEADWGNIVSYKGELILLYQDDFPATRWIRVSKDSGETWSPPTRPWRHIGSYEQSVFLKDSADQLHVILGNRAGDCCHGMWHSVYRNGQWQDLSPITTGPKTVEYDPITPYGVVNGGNMLMVAWMTDTGPEDLNGAWYSIAYVDNAKPTPPRPLKEHNIVDDYVEVPNVLETVEPNVPSFNTDVNFEANQPSSKSLSKAIILGIVASLLGVVLVMTGWYFFYRL